MEEIKTVALAVIIAIAVGFTSLDVFIALSERKNARGRKPRNVEGRYDE